MIVCRICMAKNICKDTNQLQHDVKDRIENRNCTDVMLFCLNIQVESDTKASKLCLKCYKKIIAFYKFKLLALENDKYFQALENNEECEVYLHNNDIKEEPEEDNIHDSSWEVKHDTKGDIIEIKQECQELGDGVESDDELLIAIKQQKKPGISDDSKENLNQNAVSVLVKKKRGRKKQEVSGEKLKICEECGKGVRQLREHMARHKDISERKVIKCKNCDKLFSTHAARYRHNKHKHLGIKEICTLCNKSVCHLKAHMKQMHAPDALKYPCPTCGRRFISATKLALHALSHSEVRPYKCDVCHNTFRAKAALSLHIRSVHEMEKSHMCQYCSKSFFKKYHLQLHIRTHTKEKPYKCEECGKRFATSNIFNIHRKRHAGDKNVPCKFCDMTFICSSGLTSHMVTHTKVKRHACQYCGVKFYRSDHRLKHERTAHLKHMNIAT